MKKIFFIIVLALGLSACNLDIEQTVETPEVGTGTAVYQVRIPASFGADTKAVAFDGTNTAVSTFAVGDKVYIYNETKEAMACDDQGSAIALTLTAGDLSNGGKNCTLRGNLTFHKYENSTWTPVTVDGTDSYKLLYNLSDPNTEDPIYSNFWYVNQNGTAAGIADYAIATTTLTDDGGQLTPTSTVSFQNEQSMFRFQFTSGGSPVNVRSVSIASQNDALAKYYYPLDDDTYKYYRDIIPVSLSSATTGPIYVALCIDESNSVNDVLTFEVIDADNKLYSQTKAGPGDGFVNGKYYYNSSAIDLGAPTLQLVKPTLSRSDGGNDSELADADANRWFNIYSPSESGAGIAEGITMSISNTSTGYRFQLNSGRDASNTVGMSGLTATFDDVDLDYIASPANLTLNISGDNAIRCRNSTDCIYANGDLKLSGNGTLTVTANDATEGGLCGWNNYNPYRSTDPSVLAAPGHIVTRSARTDNADGTYTWTYTVYPTNVDLSSVTTTDGKGQKYYAAKDGQVLAGDFSDFGYVTIADGATVTLNDVSIWAPSQCDHAAIHCLGSANVIVSGSNMNSVTAQLQHLSRHLRAA